MSPTAIDQTHLCRSSDRKTADRAASVVRGPESPGLEVLRLKEQESSFLDVEDTPPSSLPTGATARGRKRDLSPRGTSQPNLMTSTSALVTKPIADSSELRPRKKQRRSASTPVAIRSRRRPRSRVGSPTTNAEYIPPSRISVRLARKTHPFITSRSSDIYAHLAAPDGAGNLSNGSPVGSAILSTPKDVESVKKPRGRRRKTVDLRDENAKKDLMEEWAQLRQSQGTFPLSGIDKNACLNQMLPYNARKGDGSASSMQPETITRKGSPHPNLAKGPITTADTLQSQDTILNVYPERSSLACMGSENTLLMDTGVTGNKLDYDGLVPPAVEAKQLTVPGKGVETSSTTITDRGVDKDTPSDEPDSVPETIHQKPEYSPRKALVSHPWEEDSVGIRHTLPSNEQMEATNPSDASRDSRPVTLSQTYSLDSNSVRLDSDEEFYMLDMPEIFTLPWAPMASHLYVPPSLGKLVSGMREQLVMAARARQRAEELYEVELGRRVSAERIIADLRIRLEEIEKDAFERGTPSPVSAIDE